MDLVQDTVEVSIDPSVYDRLQHVVETSGPEQAIDELISELRESGDFNNLFYALLMKKRVQLGISPFPSGNASELPVDTHEEYEQTIREAGRFVGHLFLERGSLTKAWAFFRMLGEPEPVREALARFEPTPEDDIYPIVEIAWQNGVLPKKGFDLILDRHGICSAITTIGSSDLSSNSELRDYCVGRLVRALHEQLSERIRADLLTRGVSVAPDEFIGVIATKHPELFADDSYHIDTSHLSSVVQMSLYLPAGHDNELAIDLCEYGRHLSAALRVGSDAPFEDGYEDYLSYLQTIAGIKAESGIERFRGKAAREAREGATYAAQVYVNLLVRLGRIREALEAATAFLMLEDERGLICPGISELSRRLGDYSSLSKAAKERKDPVLFLASLIASKK